MDNKRTPLGYYYTVRISRDEMAIAYQNRVLAISHISVDNSIDNTCKQCYYYRVRSECSEQKYGCPEWGRRKTQMATTTSAIPSILTANTYFWRPSGSASGRRANEKRHIAEVASFIADNQETLNAAKIEIDFDYSESCHNVYKHCSITRKGRRSNITAVRKALGVN